MVDDHHQGKGIATLLLEHLAAIARSNGIERFTAEVLADNRPMLAVFSRAGWPVERHFESGVIDLDFPLDQTEEFLDSMDRREQRADSRAMARSAAAPIDRRRRRNRPPWLRSERHCGATSRRARPDRSTPVNPNHSTRRRPAVVAVGAVDPRRRLAGRRRRPCRRPRVGDRRLHRVAGARCDHHHRSRRHRRRPAVADRPVPPLRHADHRARQHGRGGFAAVDRPAGARWCPRVLPPGPVAISMQSGSLGASVLRLAEELGIGMSWFVSLGDKGDVSGNDLLQFWEDDETTRVIAMYTETFGNPRKFARIARRVSRQRPDRRRAHRRGRGRADRWRAVPAGRADRGADGGRAARHRPDAGDAAGAVGPTGRRAGQRAQPGALAAGRADDGGARAGRRRRSRSTGGRRPHDYEAAVRAALAAAEVDGVIVVHAPPLADGRRAARRRDRGGSRRRHQAGRRRADGRPQRPAAPRLGGPGLRLP